MAFHEVLSINEQSRKYLEEQLSSFRINCMGSDDYLTY